MEKLKPSLLNLAILCTLLAIGFHVYLAQQHYGLKFGLAGAPSVCNVNSTFNCDAVAASSYSVFMGIPLAVWGALTNLVLLFFLVVTRLGWTDHRESTARWSLGLSLLVALASVVMLTLSLMFMQAYCLFCMACYALSFLGVFFAWKGTGESLKSWVQEFPLIFTSQRWILITLVFIPVGAFLWNKSAITNSGFQEMDREAASRVAQWKNATEFKFDTSKGLIVETEGTEPKLTIVEFADFLCPHCKHAYPTLDAFAKAHPDVKLIFKFFPLDGSCNPDPAMNGTKQDSLRCHIPALIQCAQNTKGEGWKAHHYFFDRQDSLFSPIPNDSLTEQFSKEMGYDAQAMKACAQSPEVKDEIRRQAQEGVDAKVGGTPTIFVNGKILNGGQLLPVLESAYQSLQ